MSSVPEKAIVSKSLRHPFISLIDQVLEVSTDRRDEWSTNLKDYQKGAVLSGGAFGMVVSALCSEHNGRGNDESRSCALKIRYVGRCVNKILNSRPDEETSEFENLVKQVVIEVYLMSRVRHANLIHLHASLMDQNDIIFVLPRFYCLETLIQQWRQKMKGESISAELIMRIVRQVCIALDFLATAKIILRTLQADHIYLTRNGTVKLAHFSAAKLMNDGSQCVTPVGNKEYMCFEKQFNLLKAEAREACFAYNGASDVWALGVVVLRMISFFPNEQWQRLQPDFANTMQEERMPFKWVMADLTQLRVRMRKAASGADLCRWLSEKVFTIKASKRCSPAQLLASKTLKKFCSATVEQDSKILYDRLLCVLDWPNRDRLETNRPNYDCLESKDIPAEFYWDDYGTWKIIERATFEYQCKVYRVETENEMNSVVHDGQNRARRLGPLDENIAVFSGRFLFSEAQVLLSQLGQFVTEGRIYWSDLLLIDGLIRHGASEVMGDHVGSQRATSSTPFYEETAVLPKWGPYGERKCSIEVRLMGFKD